MSDIVLPVGHIVEVEVTPAAALGQFGIDYTSDGRRVRGAGHPRRVGLVLREAVHDRGWWVDMGGRRCTLLRPEDVVGVLDCGAADDSRPCALQRPATAPRRVTRGVGMSDETSLRQGLARAFHADLARMNAELERLGAVCTEDDGFMWIDEGRVPSDLMRAYKALVSYGYAYGLFDDSDDLDAVGAAWDRDPPERGTKTVTTTGGVL